MSQNKFFALLLTATLVFAQCAFPALTLAQQMRSTVIRLKPQEVGIKTLEFTSGLKVIRLGKKIVLRKQRTDAYCHRSGLVGSLSKKFQIRSVKKGQQIIQKNVLQYFIFKSFVARNMKERSTLSTYVANCSARIQGGSSSSNSSSTMSSSSSSSTSSIKTSSSSSSSSSSNTSSANSSSSSSQSSSTSGCVVPAGFTAIHSVMDLKAIEANPSGSYILCNDLSLSDEFTPLFNTTRFSGVLNGNNFSIRGLRITNASANGAALIMATTNQAHIQNLIIEAPEILSNLLSSALVAANAGSITNVHIFGGHITSTHGWVGAIAGISSVRPIDCSTTAEISGTNTLSGLVGLLAPAQ